LYFSNKTANIIFVIWLFLLRGINHGYISTSNRMFSFSHPQICHITSLISSSWGPAKEIFAVYSYDFIVLTSGCKLANF